MRYFLFLFITPLGYSQSYILDSLYKALENHPQEDSLRVNILVDISWYEYTCRSEINKVLAQQALNISRQLNYIRGISNGLLSLGPYYWAMGDYQKSTQYGYDMLKISIADIYPRDIGQGYQLLALINQLESEPKKANEFYGKVMDILKKENLKGDVAACYNLMGTFNMSISQLELATDYFFKSANVASEINDEDRLSSAYVNLALVFYQENECTKAQTYFQKSLEIALKLSDTYRITLIYIGMGSVYTLIERYDKAESYLGQSLTLAEGIHHKKKLEENYNKLALLKQKQGKFQEALNYFELGRTYRDSIYTEDKAREIAEIERHYETEKKDQVIQLLVRDQHIQLVRKKILIASLILVTLLSVFAYYLQRYHEAKNREILTLQVDSLTVQHNELSEKYKNVMITETEPALASQDQRLLKKAMEIVEHNMSDPLFGVDKMAVDMGMSRTNMHRKLKEITGFPPSELIRSIRLRKAALLIRNETDSISQISLVVGFEDRSYFSKAFKKHFGVSPSGYLQSIKENEQMDIQNNDSILGEIGSI